MNDATFIEAVNYCPPTRKDYHEPARLEQGGLIEKIREIARTPIEDDKVRTTRCMTLKSVDRACYQIGMNEGQLSPTKVFIALMTIGYNLRYHNAMQNSPDALHMVGSVVSKCVQTNDIDIVDMVMGYRVFTGTKSKTYRLDRAKMGEADKAAMGYGIDRSELNLFNVLTGLERVLSEESYYIERRDDRLFRAPMDEFLSAKRKLEFRLVSLHGILAMV